MLFSEPVRRLESAVRSAAAHLWERAESEAPMYVSVKPDNTLVLNLDIESHKILLASLFGTLPIVSEEDESTHGLIDTANEYYVIDPLDGTTSCKRFLAQLGGQVGFGPLGGYVKNNIFKGAVFFHIPHRTLYVAERGVGSFYMKCDSPEVLSSPSNESTLTKLIITESVPLIESGTLFFAGTGGELRVIEYLRRHNLVENVYRFGGFANDCIRLSHNYEQIQIQFSVKAWDLAAALISELAGIAVILEPRTSKTPLAKWQVTHANPLVSGHQQSISLLLDAVKGALP